MQTLEIFCRFNQDAACLTLGLRSGYRIYDCSPFAQRFSTEGGGMGHVEMLFCTSLVVLVGGGDQVCQHYEHYTILV
jgi:autophagy-related protein 18